ncbi:MAG: PHP domain-containing protein [Deltaproteobacteria bacterium]|nr:MAG: PHP domain-containing protein [Deltaproteobacteria bacterium]
MAGCVDLHMHSTFSDGTLAPAALVAEAAAVGLRAIALADHDNIDGIGAAQAAGREHGVEVVPGVELSVVWGELNDLHLLGYAFDPDHPALNAALSEFRAFRAGRSERILERINAQLAGEGRAPIPLAAVRERAGGTIGRPHLGQALIAAGCVRTMEEAFLRYLGPCNVPKRFFPVAEAIDLVHAAGGCAVLAHPMFIGVADAGLPALLDTLIGLGLDGMECWCGGATNDTVDRLLTLARRRGLIPTGGSDFHQPGMGPLLGSGLGNLRIPYACVEELRAKAEKYRDER